MAGPNNIQLPANQMLGSLDPVATKTASYTVTIPESQTLYANTGASGAIVLTLSSSQVGLFYGAFVDAAQQIQFKATNGDKFQSAASVGAANGTLTNTGVSGSIVWIEYVKAGLWLVIGTPVGTWTVA